MEARARFCSRISERDCVQTLTPERRGSSEPRSTFFMKLISLQDQTIDGTRHLKVGEKFEMSDASGRFLIATKRAKIDNTEEPKKGKYNRRDMRAEN